MGRLKLVEPEHLDFLRTYFSKKLVDGSLSELLSDPALSEDAVETLRQALAEGSVVGLNDWFGRYLSLAGRRAMWTAFRNVRYRKKSPLADQVLRKSVVREVMDWAEAQGIDDLNAAVLALLEAQKE
jgi:hypothetical protein